MQYPHMSDEDSVSASDIDSDDNLSILKALSNVSVSNPTRQGVSRRSKRNGEPFTALQKCAPMKSGGGPSSSKLSGAQGRKRKREKLADRYVFLQVLCLLLV